MHDVSEHIAAIENILKEFGIARFHPGHDLSNELRLAAVIHRMRTEHRTDYSKAISVEVTKCKVVGLEGSNALFVHQVRLNSSEGLWCEEYGSEQETAAFLRGVTAGTMLSTGGRADNYPETKTGPDLVLRSSRSDER